MSEKLMPPVAVSVRQANESGCPNCGFQSVRNISTDAGSTIAECGECKYRFAMLSGGIVRSSLAIDGYFPDLVEHPRPEPAHERLAMQPKHGSEYFRSEGIVNCDTTPGCFECDSKEHPYHCLTAYINSQAIGEHVVSMFHHGAQLVYFRLEPDFGLVKVGACSRHLEYLERLHMLTKGHHETISREIIRAARKVTRIEFSRHL